MEISENYRGYSIRYYSATGTTIVERHGIVVEQFRREGVIKGKTSACNYIDRIQDHYPH